MRLPLADLEATAARVMERGGDALRGQSIFITGGTGYVGRWLIETLCALNASANLGARIIVLSRNVERFRASAPHLAGDSAVELIEGGLQHAVLPHCDLVIHGATASAEALAADPRLFLETVEGTRDALDLAVRAGARRFLYLSSGAVYGASADRIPEDFRGAPDVLDPKSVYGEVKRAGELLCASYARRFGLEVVMARIFSFIGPHVPLDSKFAAGSFLRDALQGERIEVQGDGTAIRSYLYAADLAIWLWVLLCRGASGRAYNAGSEVEVSIGELAREAAQLHDPPLPVTILGTPSKRVDRYVPSTARARTELGLAEWTDWRSALRRTYDWYRVDVPAGTTR